jgi:hypothetical protein
MPFNVGCTNVESCTYFYQEVIDRMTTKKTSAAPSTARDTSDAILDAMKDTSTQSSAPTSSTITTEVDEAFAKAGPASAKLKKS